MKFLFSLSFLLIIGFSYSQQTINGSFVHGGLTRTYILYVPASYSPANPAPLVFNFHGYTSNSSQQIAYGEFRPIADTAGFILVVPMGTVDGSGNTYWNANWGGTVNDVAFTAALIDTLSANYNINQNRVYSTGMSNGGFMSYYLACKLSGRIAAIASVTGAMTLGTPSTCNPQHPMPILEIHGNADGTVPYNGSNFSESIITGLNYWVNFNNANTSPIITSVPNINTSDNSTAEHYVYTGGDNCVEVEHYKILNGGHTWPGAPFNTGTTNRDINASLKIWEFFSKYDINGKIGGCITTAVEDLDKNKAAIKMYPNPTRNALTISWDKPIETLFDIKIINLLGEEVIHTTIEKGKSSIVITTSNMSKGVYFVQINNKEKILFNSKIVLN